MRATAALVAIAVAACSAAAPLVPAAPPAASRSSRAVELPRYDLDYALSWNGQLLGAATESVARHDDGYRLRRHERVRVRRGGVTVEIALDIEIVTGADLVARSVVVRHLDASGVRVDRARRDGDRWRIDVAGEATRYAAGDAVPAELVSYLEDRAYRGPVLLSGRAFAPASLTVAQIGPRRLRARLSAGESAVTSEIELGDDGAPERIVGPGPLGALRVATAPALPETPPELVDGTAIALGPAPADGALQLVGIERGPPPPLPGQQITASDGAWRIAFTAPPEMAASRARELETLVAIARTRLTADLGHSARSGADALSLARGDCNAYALLFAELAEARGHRVRIVTGFRRDGDRLLRHRWAMVRVDESWIPIDPTFAEVPAKRGALLGLVAHGTTAADLAVANLAYAGTERARAN